MAKKAPAKKSEGYIAKRVSKFFEILASTYPQINEKGRRGSSCG